MSEQKWIASGWKAIGIDEDVCECGYCGKRNLKFTVVLQHEAGGLLRYGRDCAARMLLGRRSESAAAKVERVARQEAERQSQAAADLLQRRLNRIATGQPVFITLPTGERLPIKFDGPKQEANYRYHRTGRALPGSYFAQRGSQIVRIDGTDNDDVAFFEAAGFVAMSTPVSG